MHQGSSQFFCSDCFHLAWLWAQQNGRDGVYIAKANFVSGRDETFSSINKRDGLERLACGKS